MYVSLFLVTIGQFGIFVLLSSSYQLLLSQHSRRAISILLSAPTIVTASQKSHLLAGDPKIVFISKLLSQSQNIPKQIFAAYTFLPNALAEYINSNLDKEYEDMQLTGKDISQNGKIHVYQSINASIVGKDYIQEQDIDSNTSTKRCVASANWYGGSRFDDVEIQIDADGMSFPNFWQLSLFRFDAIIYAISRKI